MAAYLVTHSLLSSWLHLIRENPYEDLTTEGDPLAEFMLVLRREPTPRTEAMQNGIDFENLVTAIVNGHDDPNNPWNWAAGQIAAIIKGGQLQFKARRTIQVRGMNNNSVKHIPLDVLDKLCTVLDCQPADLLEFVPDENEKSPDA